LVAALPLIGSEQLRPDPVRSEKIAFRRQEGQLIGNVDPPKVGTELDAIKDRDRVAKTDMLGSQVAMSVNYSGSSNALLEDLWMEPQELQLKAVYPFHNSARQMMPHGKEFKQVAANVRQVALTVLLGHKWKRLQRAVKANQDIRQSLDMRGE
jgi:hypothetical protein